MTVEITGKVTKVGRVKDYGHPEGTFSSYREKYVPNCKFFMEVESKDQGIILAMVQCKGDDTEYGYKIPKDADRQKPLIGDHVKFTTHTIKENGAKWASVTWNQDFKITYESRTAKKDLTKFIEKKKQEREDEKKQQREEAKQRLLEADLEYLGHIETQKHDERFPEAVREVINKTFNFDTILGILHDTVWFVTPEGEGGKTADFVGDDSFPGTGMRRPGGVLHGHPATVRTSILNKAIDSGLIIKTEKGYKATESGIKTLVKIDTCPECNELRKPYSVYSHYANWSTGYSQTNHLGARYYCTTEKSEMSAANQGSNCGTTVKNYKNTEKKFAEIMKIVED